jgi:hypothetical protein
MLRKFLAAMLLVPLLACGDDTTGPGVPYTQTLNDNVTAFGTTSHNVTAVRAGTMTITLTWVGPADLDLYLTNRNCTDIDDCTVYDESIAASGNSEAVSKNVTKDELLKLWVDSFHGSSVAYTLRVRIE